MASSTSSSAAAATTSPTPASRVAKATEKEETLSDAMKEEVLRTMLAPQEEEEEDEEEQQQQQGAARANRACAIPDADETKSLAVQEQLFAFEMDGAAWDVSVHEAPKSLRRDLKTVFRAAIQEHRLDPTQLKVVPTVQHTSLSTLALNADTAREKDLCLERFVRFANKFCDALGARGFWADFTDPCCGLPMRSPGNTVYPDIQGLVRLRSFPTAAAGCCHIALHPEWGECMYPATMFTVAPMEVVVDVLKVLIQAPEPAAV